MQGEPVEALSQMAQKKHKIMNIEEGDSVFLAITASANMEVIIADVLNELHAGHTSSLTIKNPCFKSWLYGRIKMMLNIMKPNTLFQCKVNLKCKLLTLS